MKKFPNYSFSIKSFIHTVLLNSEFCEDYMSHNLRYTSVYNCVCEEEKLKYIDSCGCRLKKNKDFKEKTLVPCTEYLFTAHSY
jgi:hypothetical protein